MILNFKPRFFIPEEFRCKCCGMGGVHPHLVYILEMTRRCFDRPMIVTSGLRCLKHNKEVGGAVNSRHLLGLAADITTVTKYANDKLYKLFNRLLPEWQDIGGELIYNAKKGYIHIALPRLVLNDTYSKWDGNIIGMISTSPPTQK